MSNSIKLKKSILMFILLILATALVHTQSSDCLTQYYEKPDNALFDSGTGDSNGNNIKSALCSGGVFFDTSSDQESIAYFEWNIPESVASSSINTVLLDSDITLVSTSLIAELEREDGSWVKICDGSDCSGEQDLFLYLHDFSKIRLRFKAKGEGGYKADCLRLKIEGTCFQESSPEPMGMMDTMEAMPTEVIDRSTGCLGDVNCEECKDAVADGTLEVTLFEYNDDTDWTARAKIKNNGDTAYLIGLASYKKYDEIVDHQTYYDHEEEYVQPGTEQELLIDLPYPHCKYQLDFFCGSVLYSLDGERYGDRKINDYYHHGPDEGSVNDDYCAPPDCNEPCRVPPGDWACPSTLECINQGSGPDICRNPECPDEISCECEYEPEDCYCDFECDVSQEQGNFCWWNGAEPAYINGWTSPNYQCPSLKETGLSQINVIPTSSKVNGVNRDIDFNDCGKNYCEQHTNPVLCTHEEVSTSVDVIEYTWKNWVQDYSYGLESFNLTLGYMLATADILKVEVQDPEGYWQVVCDAPIVCNNIENSVIDLTQYYHTVRESDNLNVKITVKIRPTGGMCHIDVCAKVDISYIQCIPSHAYCGDGSYDSAIDGACEWNGQLFPAESLCELNSQECRDDCTCCGDGVLQEDFEECDPAINPGHPDYKENCQPDCTTATFCGNDIAEWPNDALEYEYCDDGDYIDFFRTGSIEHDATKCYINGNSCTGDCTCCGDGVLQGDEECDINRYGYGVPCQDNSFCNEACQCIEGCNCIDFDNGISPGQYYDPSYAEYCGYDWTIITDKCEGTVNSCDKCEVPCNKIEDCYEYDSYNEEYPYFGGSDKCNACDLTRNQCTTCKGPCVTENDCKFNENNNEIDGCHCIISPGETTGECRACPLYSFYYCPHITDSDEYWFVENSIFYDVTGYDFEDCTTNIDNVQCCLHATDCVDEEGKCRIKGTGMEVDDDKEYEVCYSYGDKLGAWVDPDMSPLRCNDLIDELGEENIAWFDCRPLWECNEGINDYSGEKSMGLCCGDEFNEHVLHTQVYENDDVTQVGTYEYTGCCDDITDCVDQLGNCVSNGNAVCYMEGIEIQCSNGKWIINENPDCPGCDDCDLTEDGWVKPDDLVLFRNMIDQEQYDPDLDVNKNNVLDEYDYNYCANPPIFGSQCFICGNGVITSIEECEFDSSGLPYTFTCVDNICEGNYVKQREGCNNETCSCTYAGGICNPPDCGADCVSDASCLNSTCSGEYDDYCNGVKLIDYDNNDELNENSIIITRNMPNYCTDCVCTTSWVDCSAPQIPGKCVAGICNAECGDDSQCPDNEYCDTGTCSCKLIPEQCDVGKGNECDATNQLSCALGETCDYTPGVCACVDDNVCNEYDDCDENSDCPIETPYCNPSSCACEEAPQICGDGFLDSGEDCDVSPWSEYVGTCGTDEYCNINTCLCEEYICQEPVDVAFIIDSSGSMVEEVNYLCDAIATINNVIIYDPNADLKYTVKLMGPLYTDNAEALTYSGDGTSTCAKPSSQIDEVHSMVYEALQNCQHLSFDDEDIYNINIEIAPCETWGEAIIQFSQSDFWRDNSIRLMILLTDEDASSGNDADACAYDTRCIDPELNEDCYLADNICHVSELESWCEQCCAGILDPETDTCSYQGNRLTMGYWGGDKLPILENQFYAEQDWQLIKEAEQYALDNNIHIYTMFNELGTIQQDDGKEYLGTSEMGSCSDVCIRYHYYYITSQTSGGIMDIDNSEDLKTQIFEEIEELCEEIPVDDCGNGVIDLGESCDKTEFNGLTCKDFDEFTGGDLTCTDECEINTQYCFICDNDGEAEAGESCDGTDLNGKSCNDFDDFTGGELGCDDTCDYDTRGCYFCDNDGIAEPGEACDGTDLNGMGCDDFDEYPGGGFLTCDDTCNYDTSLCEGYVECHENDIAEPGEACDGTDLNGKSCTDFDEFTEGDLYCDTCQYDTQYCIVCNNDNTADIGEACDRNDLRGLTCTDFDNFTDGDLSCDSYCNYNTDGCFICDNDGEAEAGESCDGTDLNGKSCNDFDDFKSGSLACDNTCNFDTSGCKTESDDDDDDDDDSGGGGGGGGGGKKIYPDTEERCDKDGDTYLSEECDGNDCNDYYAFINPGALEKCDNMDDDCDGRIDEGCDDDNDNYCDDNMGYSTHTRSCSVPGDCNDLEPEINPGVVEKCNNVDDNCNGKIDEGCTSEDYQISLSAEPEVTPRIFSKFKVSAYVENKMDTPLEKIKLDIEVPSSWEVTSPVIIQKLNAFEKEKITFDIIIKDYTEEKATLTLKATVNKNVIYESFDLDVVIPDFLVAVEPSLYDHKDKLKRGFYYLDFYYVINNKGKLKINYPQDIEFDINTGTITYALEYVSNLKIPADTIVINKIGSFDLPKGRQYFVEGTLWKNPSFLSKVKADQSREILILD